MANTLEPISGPIRIPRFSPENPRPIAVPMSSLGTAVLIRMIPELKPNCAPTLNTSTAKKAIQYKRVAAALLKQKLEICTAQEIYL